MDTDTDDDDDSLLRRVAETPSRPVPLRHLQPGEVLAGRFVIERRAAEGGMGSLYRARDRDNGAVVAVKTLRAKKKHALERFSEEARVLAELRHPSIVRYIAHGSGSEDALFLAMEWLEGADLSARLGRERIALSDALTMARRAAEGLGVAHQVGIVHRDVKPSNLFLVDGRPDRLKVVDFGVARASDRSQQLTAKDSVIGTIGYMAPEQVMGAAGLDARVDVFALGCVLYELLTGHHPFEAESAAETLRQVVQTNPPPPSVLRPGLSPELDRLVLGMLAKDRARRPADGAVVERELGAIVRALGAFGQAGAAVPRLGRYRLLELLDEGALSSVHVALRDGATDPCVLKQLRPEIDDSTVAAERLYREAYIGSQLDHPRIAKVLGAGAEDGVFCVATELVVGVDLAALQRALRSKSARIPVPIAARIVLDALEALACAHAATDVHGASLGVVHRDVTPHNLMVGFDGHARMIDFGIARRRGGWSLTASGVVLGASRYMSPEQASSGTVDHRSDLYSLSVVLFELLTGKTLVAHASINDVRRAIAEVEVPSADSLNPEVSPELAAVIARGLAKAREGRWPDAQRYASALQRAVTPAPAAVVARLMGEHFADARRRFDALIALARAQVEADRSSLLGATMVETRTAARPSWVAPTDARPFVDFHEPHTDLLIAPSTVMLAPRTRRPIARIVRRAAMALGLVGVGAVLGSSWNRPGVAPVAPARSAEPSVPRPAEPAPSIPTEPAAPPARVPLPSPSPSPRAAVRKPLAPSPGPAPPPPASPPRRSALQDALDRVLAAPNDVALRAALIRQLEFHPGRARIEQSLVKAKLAPSGEVAARHLASCVSILEASP